MINVLENLWWSVTQRDNPVEQPHIDTPPPTTERTPTTESRSAVNQRRYPRRENRHPPEKLNL